MFNCSICLEKFNTKTKKKNSDIIKLKCGHKFHKKCIMNWFYEAKLNSDLCPICRECINFTNYSLNKSRYSIRKEKIKKKILEKTQNRIKKKNKENQNNYTILDSDQIKCIKSQYLYLDSDDDEQEFLYYIMHEYNIYNLYLYQVRNIILYGISYINMPPLIDDSEIQDENNMEYFKILYINEDENEDEEITEDNMLMDELNMCIGCELKKEIQKLNIKRYNILCYSKKKDKIYNNNYKIENKFLKKKNYNIKRKN